VNSRPLGHEEPGAGVLIALTGKPVSRVMVVAAHPDDEVIGAGAHLAFWPNPLVVHATDGSPRDPRFAAWAGFPDRQSYAAARHAEAVRALELANVAANQIIQLGFHDQDAARSLVDMTLTLARLIVRHRPDVIVTHPYEGGHPDHDAVCFATHFACRQLRLAGATPPALAEMTSYFGMDGKRIVSRFLQDSGGAIEIALSQADKERKSAMYRCFASQYSLLAHFPVAVECFRIAPDYDFRRGPHAGRLFYDDYELGVDSDTWLALAGESMTALARAAVPSIAVTGADTD
jgi:N-acetylglucosamine malate deacetylase 2